jgi:hypothetical protein
VIYVIPEGEGSVKALLISCFAAFGLRVDSVG